MKTRSGCGGGRLLEVSTGSVHKLPFRVKHDVLLTMWCADKQQLPGILVGGEFPGVSDYTTLHPSTDVTHTEHNPLMIDI